LTASHLQLDEGPRVRSAWNPLFPAEVAAALFGADRINFFGDQLFLKEPRSLHRTAFDQDAPYFHLEGDQCCTMWMPLNVVDRENGAMGYERGSHRWPIHATNDLVSQEPIPGSTGERLPDIEGREDDFDVVYYESEPGDVIVHHVRTVHGSTGNLSADRVRRAVTLRYLGDDVRYLERTGAPPDSAKSSSLRNGDRMDSPEFPLVWTRSKGYVATP
jgi:ectoine hydroxylase-related dioxygenase (phytanoyl-CoA dioxygenase family)